MKLIVYGLIAFALCGCSTTYEISRSEAERTSERAKMSEAVFVRAVDGNRSVVVRMKAKDPVRVISKDGSKKKRQSFASVSKTMYGKDEFTRLEFTSGAHISKSVVGGVATFLGGYLPLTFAGFANSVYLVPFYGAIRLTLNGDVDGDTGDHLELGFGLFFTIVQFAGLLLVVVGIAASDYSPREESGMTPSLAGIRIVPVGKNGIGLGYEW